MKRFATCLLAVALMMVSVSQMQAQTTVGKADLTATDPAILRGDGGSANSVWLHTGLVMPGNGTLTNVTVRNDDDPDFNPQGNLGDEVSEEFNVLVLRGSYPSYTVIHRRQFYDDNPASITGTTDYAMNVAVQAGDTLAHWWDAQGAGAVPFSNDGTHDGTNFSGTQVGDTLTLFDDAVNSGDLDEGDIYNFDFDNDLFGGIAVRDMYISATFVPEPGTGVLMALGMISCLAVRSRKRQR